MKTIQMTIDETLLQEVDQAIANLNMRRSAFIREALEQALRHYQVRRLEERDAVGYTAVPANPSEAAEWSKEQTWEEDMSSVQAINLIAISPHVRNGRAHILGTTVTVADIALTKHYHGQDADGLADWYGLSLPQVYAALAYYYGHKETIDDQIRAQIRRAESLKESKVGSQHPLLSG